jgi:hypothetical protein
MEGLSIRGGGPLLAILEGAAKRGQSRTKPMPTTPEEAQAFVNFAVLVLQHGELKSCTVRREAIPGSRFDEGGDTWPKWTTASQSSVKMEVLVTRIR